MNATTCTVNECPLADIVICLDNSATVGAENWGSMVAFVQAVVSVLPISPTQVQVAVVDFGNLGYIDFDFAQYTSNAAVQNGISLLHYRGENANMTGGLYWSMLQLTNPLFGYRSDAPRRVIILLSVANPNVAVPTLNNQVAQIKAANIQLITIGIGSQANQGLLMSIASNPSYFTPVSSFGAVTTVVNEILGEACGVPYLRVFNECSVNNGGCNYYCNSTVNITGTSFFCSCPPGLVLSANGYTCEDVNECELNTSLCPSSQLCFNTFASYFCIITNSLNNGLLPEVSGPLNDVASSGQTTSTYSLTAVALAATLSAIVAVLIAVIIILIVRHVLKGRRVKDLAVATHYPSNQGFVTGSFGFGSVKSTSSQGSSQALAIEAGPDGDIFASLDETHA
jgi:hypothetical protein